MSSAQLRKLTDEELATYWSGWKPGSVDYLMAEMEVRRRQNRPSEIRGWVAIGISLFALGVSVVAIVLEVW